LSTAGSFQLGVVWPPFLQPWSPYEQLPPVICWRTGCDHRTSAIIRSWWKVSKRGWTHRHAKTDSPIWQVPHFWGWLHWEVAQVCMYLLNTINFFSYCLFY
jgi:hypothetical protein